MSATTDRVSFGATDPALAVEQQAPVVAASLATLPPTRMSVDARGLALGILAALAAVFSLSWAQTFLVPLLLGIVISYTLNPLVAWLEAIKIPRVIGTVIVMVSVIGALGLGTYSLRGQMQTIVEQLPEAATKFATHLARLRTGQIGSLQKVQDAATVVEKATTQAAVGAARSAPARHSRHRRPAFVQAQ